MKVLTPAVHPKTEAEAVPSAPVTTVTVVETSGTATDFTMSQDIQFRDRHSIRNAIHTITIMRTQIFVEGFELDLTNDIACEISYVIDDFKDFVHITKVNKIVYI